LLHAARFYDLNGNAHAIDTQGFVPDYGGSVLAFVPWAVPVPGRATAGIELDVSIGFGDTIEDVPETLRQAVRRQTFFDGAIVGYQIVIPAFGTVQGPFQITSLEFAGEHNSELTYDMTLESAGELNFAAAA
jgi:predicted secreted protein